ncbi:protein phosphatase 2C 37 [Syzygium oleosum]|uniref:protein phosphatase 2C 37 n=1 Tax=Syzygium oleosum TaxID=219896 RepID=UPI0011D28854|nr:protein phosphatase 2C 37 [Syzygium oleosum]
MAGICCGVVGESEPSAPVEPSSRGSRLRILEPRPFKFVADVAVPPPSLESGRKRPRIEVLLDEEVEAREPRKARVEEEKGKGASEIKVARADGSSNSRENLQVEPRECPKFGLTSVCGRRRDMEDAVSVEPSLCSESPQKPKGLHLFGVFDGHGCSHVAIKCKKRLHEIVREEIGNYNKESSVQWKEAMERSFARMDSEVQEWSDVAKTSNCRCELQTPQCDAVGSTAVVAIVTPDKIIVSNCGDSRAVLCRNGVAIPLSSDHKPDRPDELERIQNAGGRVIYWDGARVLGVLAMSRAIGDNYLKPYVVPDPEVTIMDRTTEDECLILASDGLWDVVSNDTACGVARMCLRAQRPPSPPRSPISDLAVGANAESSDKACSDASILLTKLALARHSTDNVSVVVVDLKRDRRQQ